MRNHSGFKGGWLAVAIGIAVAPPGYGFEPTRSSSNALRTAVAFSGEERSAKAAEVQILLARVHHSPGAIDGVMGPNTRRAIRAYQRFNGMAVTGQPSTVLLERLRADAGEELFHRYVITEDDVAGPFRNIPTGMVEQAKLDQLAYETPTELLAEKFQMTQAFLAALNPHSNFSKAGTHIRVVQADSGDGLPKVATIEVEKEVNELRALSADGKVIATYPVTVGSAVHPSPDDTLEVLAVAPNPTYGFDPSGRSWGPDRPVTIAPGPNNPVGAVWIDLSRDGFGIHGTPEPRLIGKTTSHGCVRMTNWDALELSRAVDKGTTVRFL